MFLAKGRKKAEGGFAIDRTSVKSGLMLLGYFGALRLVSFFLNKESNAAITA
jgi:hypothetical protein